MKNEGTSSPVERALWFVENRPEGEISLGSIAESAGVTEHHLARAFGRAQTTCPFLTFKVKN
jgi:transcriptional regulator GlxA family with amidase domain